MCEALDCVENRGIEIGIQRGTVISLQIGSKIGRFESVKRFMKNLHLSLEQAMDALDIIPEERKQFREILLQEQDQDILDLFQIFKRDKQYKEELISAPKAEVKSMADVLDRVEYMGWIKGLEQGIEQDIKQGVQQEIEQAVGQEVRFEAVRNLIKNLHLSLDQTMDALKISPEERKKFRELL